MVRVLAKDEFFQTAPYRKRYETKEIKEKHPFFNFKNKLITSIAKKSLTELIVSSVFVGVACAFISSPAGIITLIISSLAVVVFSTLLRSIATYAHYKMTHLSYDNGYEARQKRNAFSFLKSLAETIAPWGYSDVVDKNTRDVLVHEAGHALAAKILVKKPDATVSILPFKGGATSYRLGALTKIGEFFGREKSKAIVSAAGPFVAVATSTVMFGVSYAIDKKRPEFARYMRYSAIDSILNQAFYALSALWVNPFTNRGHDFIQLWASGVHPLLAVVATLVAPIFIKIGQKIHQAIKIKKLKKIAESESKRDRSYYKIKIPSTLNQKEKALIKSNINFKYSSFRK